MPLVSRHKVGDAELLVWRIGETGQELMAMAGEADRLSVAGLASPARRRERLAWRLALRSAVPGAVITYDAQGAPRLEGSGVYISAAHTAGLACVAVSPQKCAVDVENRGRDFSRVAGRYMSARERELLAGVPDAECMVWCVKEALYKYAGREGLDFMGDIAVTGYDAGRNIAEGMVCGEKATVRIVDYEEYMMAVIA